MKYLLILMLVLFIGCASDDPPAPKSLSLDNDKLAHFYVPDLWVKAALKSIGASDREPVKVLHLPMAINRLMIELKSLNPDVPNLRVGFCDTNGKWELESPTQKKINEWLTKSSKP